MQIFTSLYKLFSFSHLWRPKEKKQILLICWEDYFPFWSLCFPLKYYFLCQANTYFCLDHLLVLLLPFDTAGESLIVLPQNDFSPYLKTIINLLAPWSVFCITNPSSDNFSRIEFASLVSFLCCKPKFLKLSKERVWVLLRFRLFPW